MAAAAGAGLRWPRRFPIKRFPARLAPFAAAVLIAACAGRRIESPSLVVERVKVERVQITGAGLLIGFKVRNPNADPIRLERFRYDLWLNGHRLGTGYVTEAVDLEGFGQASVSSRFDLNVLQLPGTVKSILDADRADAEVKGTFRATAHGRQHDLPFHTAGGVSLEK